MNKLIIFFILFCFTSAFPQVLGKNYYYNYIQLRSSDSENSVYNKSISVNIAPAIFFPVSNFGSNTIGTGLNIGVQYNYSEKHSLSLDFDLAYTKRKNGNVVSDKWISYMQLEFGPKFYLQRNENLDIFAAPEIGIIFASDRDTYGKETNLPLCVSFEAGLNYKMAKNLSALLKIKNNIQIIATIYNFDLNDFLLINGGLSIRL
jgi:hypothetical protein